MNQLPSGTYGMVLPQAIPNEIEGKEAEYPAESQSFPNDITKVFFRRPDYNELINRIPNIQRLFGNDPNYAIHPYRRNLRLGNVSNRATRKKVSNKLKAVHGIVSPNNFPNNTPLPAIHLPHLGVDFHDLYNEDVKRQLRRVPVRTMLAHVLTVLQSVDFLTNQEDRESYIHGDIRPPNLMIRPATGQITLIDFDWLRELSMFSEEYPIKSLYHTPPELLLYGKRQLPGRHDKVLFASQQVYQKPDERQLRRLRQLSTIEPYNSNINTYCAQSFRTFDYIKHLYQSEDVFRTIVGDAINDSIEYYADLDRPYLDSFHTFDSYGLGQNLMELFCTIYPTSTTIYAEELDQLTAMLATRLIKGGEPYTPAELRASAVAIFNMVQGVLIPLCSLDLRTRKRIKNVIEFASQLVNSLDPVNPVEDNQPSNENLTRNINFHRNRIASAEAKGENTRAHRNHVRFLMAQRGYGKKRSKRTRKR